MRLMQLGAVAAAVLSLAAGAAVAATQVDSGGSGAVGNLTSLGTFDAGTYLITASGIVDLALGSPYNLLVDANGVPTGTVTAPYTYFNPNGAPGDVFQPGVYGAAGSSVNLGALIGSFSAAPASPGDWFVIGTSKTITLTSTQTIYASVNDTYHQNNSGFFSAAVTAVPEPESHAMMLAGLGVVGWAARRRRERRV